jgi:uncharacterized protein YndB with AHSA1/START domain
MENDPMRRVDHSEFVIERVLAAKLDRAFRAFSEEKSKRQWFACDEEMEIAEYSLDFRPGGAEVNRILTPSGEEHLFLGHYLDIVPEERIIYSYSMHVGEIRLSASLVTIVFRSNGASTSMTYTEQIAMLDGHQPVAERIRGTELGFDMLDQKLQRL